MPALKLVSVEAEREIDLPAGKALVLGRAVDTDIQVPHPTISRRHAEIVASEVGVAIKDLGSFNGTHINGVRVGEGIARVHDSVAFGTVAFRVVSAEPSEIEGGTTVLRQVSVRDKAGALVSGRAASAAPDAMADATKLSRLLEIAQRLSGEIALDQLLEAIVDTTFEAMRGDRVSILLSDGDGRLVSRLSRNRRGHAESVTVPRSIAERAVTDRVAILSTNAADDARFSGESVLQQNVRGAMCTPLMAAGDEVFGILYVDNTSTTGIFTEDDLRFLAAFGGIAAVSIKNSRYAEQLRREATIRANFERYFAPRVAAQIVEAQSEVQLGGARRPLAILFSDIRGFTSISERLSPEVVAALLNEYFTEMVDVVFEHGGTLDKFIGDGMLALWGAPIPHPDDPTRALEAAVAMQQALVGLRERWKAQSRPQLEVGIGISYGEVFVGNIGSDRRLEYSVLGDAVNTAARLCAEAGPGEILVTESLGDVLPDWVHLERLAPLSLKGKAEPVPVYRAVTAR